MRWVVALFGILKSNSGSYLCRIGMVLYKVTIDDQDKI